MDQPAEAKRTQIIGVTLIVFAIAFNVPYAWLASAFEYPDILRRAPGEILTAFAAGGTPLIVAWAAFALAALVFAPIAVAVSVVARSSTSSAVAGLGDWPIALGLCGAGLGEGLDGRRPRRPRGH